MLNAHMVRALSQKAHDRQASPDSSVAQLGASIDPVDNGALGVYCVPVEAHLEWSKLEERKPAAYERLRLDHWAPDQQQDGSCLYVDERCAPLPDLLHHSLHKNHLNQLPWSRTAQGTAPWKHGEVEAMVVCQNACPGLAVKMQQI